MNTTQDDGGPAFPNPLAASEHAFGTVDEYANGRLNGMSLRDYFAGMALQGCIEWERLRGVDELISDDCPPNSQPLSPGDSIDGGDQAREIASSAYAIADAMLAARKEKP